ncbi:MAG: toxic anion resistance protein [Spirochaetes bacterium]|nr:toxic anion resistance protein [Spirochaetota bacterium]
MSDSLIQKQNEAIDINHFNAEEKKKINEISSQINLEDSQGIIVYGVGAQRDISSFADTILNEIRAKDTSYVGDILTDLVVKVKDLKVDSLGGNKGFLSGLPLIGNLLNSIKKFIAKFDKLNVQIDKIVDNLDKSRMTLLKDITLMDNLYQKNQDYLKNLDLFIAAGQEKIKELNNKVIPELKAKADKSNDPKDAQKVQDYVQALNRFEKKIYDLKLSRIIAIQTSPQVRLIQSNNQVLVEKIQSSILNTIPLWKNQIVIAISLFKQKKALELQKEVSKTTDELLKKNSELLKQSAVDIARESERGIVEIDTLKKVNSDLITTIEETLRIQKEGRMKRQQAETELIKLESDLKQKLKEVKE